MLRGIGFVVAGKGEKDADGETAACLVLARYAVRMLRGAAAFLISSVRRMLRRDRGFRD